MVALDGNNVGVCVLRVQLCVFDGIEHFVLRETAALAIFNQTLEVVVQVDFLYFFAVHFEGDSNNPLVLFYAAWLPRHHLDLLKPLRCFESSRAEQFNPVMSKIY